MTPPQDGGAVAVDPITIEVIRWSYAAAADEMSHALARTAYSPVIYDMKDFSVGLFDEEVRLLGQAPGLPLFLGGLEHAVHAVADSTTPEPGDAFVLNDSYVAGSHLSDVTAVAPVFRGDELLGWTAAKAHWNDIGAKDPGFTADSTEIFQEGMRFGPVRIMRHGRWVRDVLAIIEANSRTPVTLRGDLLAQLTACRTGAERLVTLVERHGAPTVKAATEAIFAQAAAGEREFVSNLPDGDYAETGFFDSDGHSDEAVHVRVAVKIRGPEMQIDLAGSSPQRPGSTNCGLAQTVSAARLAYRYLMHDDGLVCGGNFRSLRVSAPAGSVFHAVPPAACMFYGAPLGMLINLVLKALAPIAPERVMAGQPDSSSNVLLTGRDRDGTFVTGEATAIGWGAHQRGDGQSASIDSMGGDLRNHPVETMEARHPVLVLRYALRGDSGGPGQHRGGLGVAKSYKLLADHGAVTLWFERSKMPGWGLCGGRCGAPPSVIVNRRSERLEKLKVNHMALRRGDRIDVRTGGGSGYGAPETRAVGHVHEDVLDGYVSAARAERDYGVVLTGSLAVDEAATAARRRLRPVRNDREDNQ